MAIALKPAIPDTPSGAVRHPTIRNICAFSDGTIMTYDPRIKNPSWYALQGIVNIHGRLQSQVNKKMRSHHQLVYECKSQVVHDYHSKTGLGMTIDHIDGNRLNNAFDNITAVTLRENVRKAHCKSGMPYAIRLRANGTFRVVLRVEGKMKHLGTFKTLTAAIESRDHFIRERQEVTNGHQ